MRRPPDEEHRTLWSLGRSCTGRGLRTGGSPPLCHPGRLGPTHRVKEGALAARGPPRIELMSRVGESSCRCLGERTTARARAATSLSHRHTGGYRSPPPGSHPSRQRSCGATMCGSVQSSPRGPRSLARGRCLPWSRVVAARSRISGMNSRTVGG